jgi:solute carrier family 24 (sodium/potassium/calcium exchanger), member 6
LFSAIGIASSEFFCPNLATLSRTLGMSQSFAGVTLLALGNGSPDIFSTFAAMKVGSGSLAIGELIGAAFFITSVVTGSMAIVNPFKVGRRSFLRDALFFFGAMVITVGLLVYGRMNKLETIGMIAYYLVYVTVVVLATWYWKRKFKRQQESRTMGAEDHIVTAPHEATDLLGNMRGAEETGQDNAHMEQQFVDLQHQMRLLRPTIALARTPSFHDHATIRPSLLGALEVLKLVYVANSSFALKLLPN